MNIKIIQKKSPNFDKRPKNAKINSIIIADIIYKNLSYVSQIKLKRTSPKIKEELEKIQALTMDDIDYK